jgi:hypothetical protein
MTVTSSFLLPPLDSTTCDMDGDVAAVAGSHGHGQPRVTSLRKLQGVACSYAPDVTLVASKSRFDDAGAYAPSSHHHPPAGGTPARCASPSTSPSWVRVPARRVLLALCSDFFETLLLGACAPDSGFAEAGATEVTLGDVDAEDVQLLVAYSEGRYEPSSLSDLDRMMRIQDRFIMGSLRDRCMALLRASINRESWIDVANLCIRHELWDLLVTTVVWASRLPWAVWQDACTAGDTLMRPGVPAACVACILRSADFLSVSHKFRIVSGWAAAQPKQQQQASASSSSLSDAAGVDASVWEALADDLQPGTCRLWASEVADLLDRHGELMPKWLVANIARGIASSTSVVGSPPGVGGGMGGGGGGGGGGGAAAANPRLLHPHLPHPLAAAMAHAMHPPPPSTAAGRAQLGSGGGLLHRGDLSMGMQNDAATAGGLGIGADAIFLPQWNGALVCERRRRMAKVDASIGAVFGPGVYQTVLVRSLSAMQDAYFGREVDLPTSGTEYHVYLTESDRLDTWWRVHGGGEVMHVIIRYRKSTASLDAGPTHARP